MSDLVSIETKLFSLVTIQIAVVAEQSTVSVNLFFFSVLLNSVLGNETVGLQFDGMLVFWHLKGKHSAMATLATLPTVVLMIVGDVLAKHLHESLQVNDETESARLGYTKEEKRGETRICSVDCLC